MLVSGCNAARITCRALSASRAAARARASARLPSIALIKQAHRVARSAAGGGGVSMAPRRAAPA